MGHSSSPLVIPTCRHIFDSGRFCRAGASRGQKYCRHHLRSRLLHRKMARARRRISAVQMPGLFDMQSIQLGARRLSVAVAAGRIDGPTARLMKSALDMSVNVLRLMNWQSPLNSNALYHIPANHSESGIYSRIESYPIENKCATEGEGYVSKKLSCKARRSPTFYCTTRWVKGGT